MNSLRKGLRNEKKAMALLENIGFKVVKAKITRWGGNDFFGLFDLIAVKKNSPTLFIQVKTNQTRGVKKELEKFALENLNPFNATGLFVYYDRKGWKFHWFCEEARTLIQCEFIEKQLQTAWGQRK